MKRFQKKCWLPLTYLLFWVATSRSQIKKSYWWRYCSASVGCMLLFYHFLFVFPWSSNYLRVLHDSEKPIALRSAPFFPKYKSFSSSCWLQINLSLYALHRSLQAIHDFGSHWNLLFSSNNQIGYRNWLKHTSVHIVNPWFSLLFSLLFGAYYFVVASLCQHPILHIGVTFLRTICFRFFLHWNLRCGIFTSFKLHNAPTWQLRLKYCY